MPLVLPIWDSFIENKNCFWQSTEFQITFFFLFTNINYQHQLLIRIWLRWVFKSGGRGRRHRQIERFFLSFLIFIGNISPINSRIINTESIIISHYKILHDFFFQLKITVLNISVSFRVINKRSNQGKNPSVVGKDNTLKMTIQKQFSEGCKSYINIFNTHTYTHTNWFKKYFFSNNFYFNHNFVVYNYCN